MRVEISSSAHVNIANLFHDAVHDTSQNHLSNECTVTRVHDVLQKDPVNKPHSDEEALQPEVDADVPVGSYYERKNR